MKAFITPLITGRTALVVMEKGDRPDSGSWQEVDLPPTLINEWQKASFHLDQAEKAIAEHLAKTNQKE